MIGHAVADPTADAAILTLRERAREHARADDDTGAAETEVLVCRLGTERYAIELTSLRSVCSPDGLTPVPCTPAHVAGLLNVRGEVVVILDLATALGLGFRCQPVELARVLLVERAGERAGLLVDEVLEVRRLALGSLAPALNEHSYARGVAEASIVVLDLERALSEARLEVFEEVG